jgi:transcriptional regulator GlxA family with amidase domain
LKVHSSKVRRLASVCTGAFVLGAAGLLDGRRAATHWSVAALLRQRYPAIDVDPDAIYVRDGALWTSAGVTAGIDLALALVEEDFGHALALEVARDLVMYLKRPGGQSQFSVQLASQGTAHRDIQAVQSWVLENLAEAMPLSALADRAAMSERHFRRVFVQETGQTPSAFVDAARLEGARRLLESQATLPLKSVAARVGVGSEQALRQLFLRHLGITPTAYRERFSGAGG